MIFFSTTTIIIIMLFKKTRKIIIRESSKFKVISKAIKNKIIFKMLIIIISIIMVAKDLNHLKGLIQQKN